VRDEEGDHGPEETRARCAGIVLGGQIEAERATMRQITGVGAVALLLVLTVLAGQFERFQLVLVVLASVPVAIVGAVIALSRHGEDCVRKR